MKINEAVKVFNLIAEVITYDIKKKYRDLALKYHPDKCPTGLEMMQLINSAYDAIKDNIIAVNVEIKGNLHNKTQFNNYLENYQDILSKIRPISGIKIEICGSWLWVSGNTYNQKDRLKEIGLRFSGSKKAWYYAPDLGKKRSRAFCKSLQKVRDKWGSNVINLEPQKLIA